MSEPQLSVVMVAGERRQRAQTTIDAIAAQTPAESIELILLDVDPARGEIRDGGPVPTTRIALKGATSWGAIRAAGVRAARAPIVAFIEDHCPPEPGWAEALLLAHRDPWAAVGYAFLPGDPSRWSSRSVLMAEYGFWAHPATSGRAAILPGNNISYKRDLLLALGEGLEPALEIDDNLHRHFAASGLDGAVEPRALVRHHELRGIMEGARANYQYGRLLASARARAEGWPPARRLLYALAVPPAGPALRAAHLARSLRPRRRLWGQAAAALPVLAIVWLCSAFGQAVGCVRGTGGSARRLMHWELGAARVGEPA